MTNAAGEEKAGVERRKHRFNQNLIQQYWEDGGEREMGSVHVGGGEKMLNLHISLYYDKWGKISTT